MLGSHQVDEQQPLQAVVSYCPMVIVERTFSLRKLLIIILLRRGLTTENVGNCILPQCHYQHKTTLESETETDRNVKTKLLVQQKSNDLLLRVKSTRENAPLVYRSVGRINSLPADTHAAPVLKLILSRSFPAKAYSFDGESSSESEMGTSRTRQGSTTAVPMGAVGPPFYPPRPGHDLISLVEKGRVGMSSNSSCCSSTTSSVGEKHGVAATKVTAQVNEAVQRKVETKLRTGSFPSTVEHVNHNTPARNEENVINVLAYVAVNPHVSLRVLGREIGVSKDTPNPVNIVQ
ncbi:hypothetical protein NQ318_001196 [Aromia moschata]|uniref:Uncharacterized protein n=1 Tax=Aromia moschata TaxID=1265417 RepID=A0AAV8ZGV3_9CUCU|nr:hypothetical protein NQ318_001196 [Aromia moschata]